MNILKKVVNSTFGIRMIKDTKITQKRMIVMLVIKVYLKDQTLMK